MFRRRWLWLVLFVCAIALFVLFRLQHVGESALRAEAERSLAESLDAEVRLGPLSLSLGGDLPWVGLAFQGARLQWPEVILEAEQVAAEVDPIALALGQLSMHGLRIEDLDVEFQQASPPAEARSGTGEALAQLRASIAWLREHPCFLPDTEVRNAVLARRLGGERQEWLRAISGEYDCQGHRGRAEAVLHGQLPGIPETLTFELDTRRGDFGLSLDFPTLPLARLAALLGTAEGLTGSLAGSLKFHEEAEQGVELRVDARGDALRGWARTDDAAAQPDPPLPTLRAEIQFAPGVLHVLNAELREGADSVSLEARIQGLQELAAFDPQRCAKPRKVPAMPGISGLQEWLRELPEETELDAPRAGSLDLQLDALAHPALFCTLEDLRAQLRWADTGLELELERARVAGLSLQAMLSFRESLAPERGQHWRLYAQLETPVVALKVPVAEPSTLPEGIWTRGHFSLSATSLEEMELEGAHGRVEARRSSLRLSEMNLQLPEQNAIHGHLQFSLDEAVPRFRGQFTAAELSAEVLGKAFGGNAELIEGETRGTLEIRGTLEAGRELVDGMRGHLDLHVRSGSLRARLPLLLALGTASPTSNPFRDRDRLHFDELDLVGALASGKLTVEHFELVSPALRAVSTGDVELADPYPLDLEFALFFLPRASSLVQKVPVVGKLLLGKSGDLAGAVFAIDGTLGDPKVSLVPGRTFSENLPGALLRGIPEQLLESARRIGFLGGSGAAAAPTP